MDINSIIVKIAEKRMPCLFISPHLDDAVFSAGGLLLRLVSRTKTTIVTVFTEAPPPPYTFSTRVNLKMCGGYKNAQDLFRLRKAEDAEACAAIGARSAYLGFQDASFRKKRKAPAVLKIIGKVLPEAEHIYPIYRFNIVSGKISKKDAATMIMIEKKLKDFKKKAGDCLVFCPLGIGNHADHLIVRDICAKIFPALIFWEDFPYNLRAKRKEAVASKKFIGAFDASGFSAEKMRIISLYKSQIKSLTPEKRAISFERYYAAQDKISNIRRRLDTYTN